MSNYLFSWYCTENHPRLIMRPWWKFWAHDKLLPEVVEVRKCIRLTEDEAERVQAANKQGTKLLTKLMGDNVRQVQLEREFWGQHIAGTAGNYVSTPDATDCAVPDDLCVSVRFDRAVFTKNCLTEPWK